MIPSHTRSFLVASLFVVAIGAHGVALAQPPAAPMAAITGTRLDLVATGEVTRVPDVATVAAGIVTQAPTAIAAMAANADRMAAAIAAVRRAGIADRDIRTASINLQPQYRYENNMPPVLTGYQATNQLSLRLRDVKRAGAILDTLVGQGINQISGPDFSVDKPETALDEARGRAVATARARAELYARAAGLMVARILSISESEANFAPPPRPVMMMARAEKMSADTSVEPGEQRLGVTVSVSFELK